MIPAYTVSLLWVLATFLAVTLEDQGDSCNHPPRLDFAELADEYKAKNSFPVGSTVKYICRPGYVRRKLKISRRCLQNQEWSELEEFCKKKSCGHPGEPKNGWLHVSGDFLLGATVKYSCVEGYRLIGHSSRRCIVSDKKVEWTHDIPFCEPIPCFPPPDVPYGKHSGRYRGNFFVGTVVTYTCDKGYPLVGNASIYCITEDGLNGVWSGRAYCGELHCPSPHVENGRIVTGKSNIYTYSQRVTIDCNVGHKISGSREICCQADGTWDPAIPTCKQVVQCQPPPNIQNGFHSKQEGEMFSHEMSVTYTCHPGYILLGQETIYCTASGIWSPPAPCCKAVERMLTTVSKNTDSKRLEKETKEERERDVLPGPPRETEETISTLRKQLLTLESPAATSPLMLTNELLASVLSFKATHEKSMWSLEERVQNLENCVFRKYQTCLQKTKDEEENMK